MRKLTSMTTHNISDHIKQIFAKYGWPDTLGSDNGPQLDYANAIFINPPNNSIHPMQRIQNQVAKLIMNRDRCESSISTMRQLHWLPISFRCKYKVLLLVYRCMNDQAPEYLQHKLTLKNPVRITCSATERYPPDSIQQKEDLSRLWFLFCRAKTLEQPTS